jgi:hypothetical protein
MPFDRSRQERQRRIADDLIEIPDQMGFELKRIADRNATTAEP